MKRQSFKLHLGDEGHFGTIRTVICESIPYQINDNLCITVSEVRLEFFSPLKSGFPRARHLKSTV